MFQGEPDFRYGNIHDMQPEDVASTALFQRIDSREQKVLDTCTRCSFFDMCFSGCMFRSLKNSRVFEEKDYYCGYKMYFEHMLRRLRADLTRADAGAGTRGRRRCKDRRKGLRMVMNINLARTCRPGRALSRGVRLCTRRFVNCTLVKHRVSFVLNWYTNSRLPRSRTRFGSVARACTRPDTRAN